MLETVKARSKTAFWRSKRCTSAADVSFLRLHNLDYPAFNEQRAADEAMHNLEYPASYEQKAADEAISAVNLPVNLDYPVHMKRKNNALGSAFGTGGDRLRIVSTITPMGSGSAYEAGNADVTFLQLLNLDYHAPGGQECRRMTRQPAVLMAWM